MKSFITIKKHLKSAFNVHIKNPFHIHHIDGNRSNNDILNLCVVSSVEHRHIHFIIKRENQLREQGITGLGLKDRKIFMRYIKIRRNNCGNNVIYNVLDNYYGSPIKISKLCTWTKPSLNQYK